MQALKDKGVELHTLFEEMTPGREVAIAKTKLEEAIMWAVKGLTK